MSFWFNGAFEGDGKLFFYAPVWQISLAFVLSLLAIYAAYVSRKGNVKNIGLELTYWSLALVAIAFALCLPAWVVEEGQNERGKYVVLMDGSASMKEDMLTS